MRKKLFLFMGLVLFMLSVSFSQQYQNELLNRKLIQTLAGEVSGKICFEHIRDLTVFCRWYGSDDMEKAAQYVELKAKNYGLSDAHIERFEVDEDTYYYMQKPWYAWNCTSGELRMVSPENKLITSYEANAPCVLVNSRDTDIEAEVVYVGSGLEQKDYEGKDVKGKIVLAYGYPWDVSKKAIFEKEAAGVLIAWGLDNPGSSSTEIYQTRICPWNKDKSKLSTFGFFLSTNQGRALMSHLEKGEKIILRAKVQAEIRVPGYHPGVVATIPGSTYPDEEIIFTAHLDHPRPGAHDNNSGCAVLLETARTIQSLITQGLISQPLRTIRFYWTPHVWGADMLFQTHPDLFSKIIANINVDCVGLNQTKFSSGFTVVKAPHSRASFLDDIANNFLNYLILSNNNHMGQLAYGPEMRDHDGSSNVFYGRIVPYMDYSDHIFFNSGSVGIPGVTFIDLPFGSHHSQNDKLDLLDPTQLKRISFLCAATAYCIATASPDNSFRIIDEIYYSGKSRLEKEMKLAKSILRNSDEKTLDAYYRSADNLIAHAFEREKRCLTSTRVFVKTNKEAANDLKQSISKTDRFREECLGEIRDLYQNMCRTLGIEPGKASLSEEEVEFQNIVPLRNPKLKGAFGILNTYPDDKYVFKDFSPMSAYLYELLNMMDGERNLLEIVRAVDAEALSSNYRTYTFKEISDFLQLLKKEGIIKD